MQSAWLIFSGRVPRQMKKKHMVDTICGKTVSRVKCAADIISAVKELGQEGERDFKFVHQVALNQELVEKERKLRTPSDTRKLSPPRS